MKLLNRFSATKLELSYNSNLVAAAAFTANQLVRPRSVHAQLNAH